jgi:CheY-like chemotaxis protein
MQNNKIAVIGEDKKFIFEIEDILLMGGYAPILVMDPLSADDVVMQHKPDVVLMELQMKRGNGFELTATLNRVFEARRIPIIAMSEFLKDEFLGLMNLCGIRKLLRKPFQPLDIIWAIESEIVSSHPCGKLELSGSRCL